MKQFTHHNARSVKEAVALLTKYKGKAKLNAGGTDLLGILKERSLHDYPEAIINIKTITDLSYIKENETGLKIGALTRLSEVVNSPKVQGKYKLLSEAAKSVATPQVRNMCTIGGNLAQDVRCWYYRYPHQIGGPIVCLRKGGKLCNALTGDNRYHSIFGSAGVATYPCSSHCPADTNIPSYLNKVRNGDLMEAARVLLGFNPIPAITGRVCPAFCEPECNRLEFDEPVAIRCIERALGDYTLERMTEVFTPPDTESGRSIAIIGSGPAGLAAAYYLRRSGHLVTVFERLPEAGGMLLYSIPPYRLPKDVVRKQVQALEGMGIKFELGVNVGRACPGESESGACPGGFKSRDVAVDELTGRFHAVFLAGGAWKERPLGIKGEQFALSGLEFLRRANTGDKNIPGRKVAVIGGGNVAIDVARTLLRLGAKPVIIYRRSQKEMPALSGEVEKAQQEGIGFKFLTLPTEALKANGRITLKCLRMKLGAPDASGRRQPIPRSGSDFAVTFDAVIKAIGEEPDTSLLPAGFRHKASKEATSAHLLGKNLFAGGDFITGPSTVIQAIASGREAVNLIELSLKGGQPSTIRNVAEPDFSSPSFEAAPRVLISELPVSGRVKGIDSQGQARGNLFSEHGEREGEAGYPRAGGADALEGATQAPVIDSEDTPGLSLKEIETEASRCFNCGCIAVNPSDIGIALTALDANIVTTKRTLDAQSFFIASATCSTILDLDELITEIQIPRPSDNARQNYLKFTLRKPIDFAIVNVASVITVEGGVCTDARIALGAVAPVPVRAKTAEQVIKGRPIDEDIAAEAAEQAVAGTMPLSMNAYKVEIAKTLVKRAILG